MHGTCFLTCCPVSCQSLAWHTHLHGKLIGSVKLTDPRMDWNLSSAANVRTFFEGSLQASYKQTKANQTLQSLGSHHCVFKRVKYIHLVSFLYMGKHSTHAKTICGARFSLVLFVPGRPRLPVPRVYSPSPAPVNQTFPAPGVTLTYKSNTHQQNHLFAHTLISLRDISLSGWSKPINPPVHLS